MVKRIVIISSHPIHNGTFYHINSLEDIVDFPDKVDKWRVSWNYVYSPFKKKTFIHL